MTLVSRFTGTNMAALKKVEIVPLTDGDAVSKLKVDNIFEDVDMTLTEDWESVYFTPFTATWQQNGKSGAAGSYFEQTVKFKIPKSLNGTAKYLNALSKKMFMLKVEDMNGEKWIIGLPEEPLMMSFNSGVSEKPDGFNGFEVTFKEVTSEVAYKYVASEGSV